MRSGIIIPAKQGLEKNLGVLKKISKIWWGPCMKHVLVECPDFTHIRNKFYTTTDVHTFFREVDFSKITEYLKELGLYDKI